MSQVVINEIHYHPAGASTGEFVGDIQFRIGDLNGDLWVNAMDLLLLCQAVRTNDLLGDLNKDDAVNALDVFLFIQYWY